MEASQQKQSYAGAGGRAGRPGAASPRGGEIDMDINKALEQGVIKRTNRAVLVGMHPGITGDLSGITGDLTDIRGNLTGIRGDLTGITGNLMPKDREP